MRKPIIIGNWKMNGGILFTQEFITNLQQKLQTNYCDVVICPPHVALYTAGRLLKDNSIALGAQNVYFAEKGAYTGEISCTMLKECGVKYVILGHSERRNYFKESSADIHLKIKTCLNMGLIPVVCVGESLQMRESGQTNAYLHAELTACLQGIDDIQNVILAYEPLWAIGTGKTATPKEANDTIAFIRSEVAALFSDEVANSISILYGGSMNAQNAKALLDMPEIDGGLIGGASLIVQDFADIVNCSVALTKA